MSLLIESTVFMRRNILRTLRLPSVVISTVVFPTILMLVMTAAFKGVVEGFGQLSYANLLVPAIVTTSAAFGSTSSGLALFDDISSGLVHRVATLPVSTGSIFVGRIMADVVRAISSAMILVAVGMLIGYKFTGGPIGFVAFFAFAGIVTVGFGWISLAVATHAKQMETIQSPLSALYIMLMFLAEGFIPVDGFPTWVQGFVQINPFTVFRRTLHAFASDAALLTPLLQSGAWLLGLTVIFAPIAIRGFRRSLA